MFPRGVGFGEGIGFADEGGGAVGLFAVVGGAEGFVAHTALHVVVVPAISRIGEEVQFVPDTSVVIGCHCAVEVWPWVESDRRPGGDFDAACAGSESTWWGLGVCVDVVSVGFIAHVYDGDDRIVLGPCGQTLI